MATAEEGEGPVFIASDVPVTVDRVREKLVSEGWTNIYIANEGRYLEALGLKNGKTNTVTVDAVTGRLMTGNGDGD
jgi:hypothetical protein